MRPTEHGGVVSASIKHHSGEVMSLLGCVARAESWGNVCGTSGYPGDKLNMCHGYLGDRKNMCHGHLGDKLNMCRGYLGDKLNMCHGCWVSSKRVVNSLILVLFYTLGILGQILGRVGRVSRTTLTITEKDRWP